MPGPAADAVISSSQAILAPLDVIAKPQVHAARSFLNFVVQIGYPHVPVGHDGKPLTGPNDTITKQGIEAVTGNVSFLGERHPALL